jgi:hypothetical protein
VKPFGVPRRRIGMKAHGGKTMSPLKPIVAITAALIFLSFSVTIASDHAPKDATDDDVAAVASVEVEIPVEATPESAAATETPRSALATVKATLRAGVNLTRALYRSAAHTAIVIARTVYLTATALT